MRDNTPKFPEVGSKMTVELIVATDGIVQIHRGGHHIGYLTLTTGWHPESPESVESVDIRAGRIILEEFELTK